MSSDFPTRLARRHIAAALLVALAAAAQARASQPDDSLSAPEGPPGTLFQWSYGTSFSGGPTGRDEPLDSDRPDFTEASNTVGRGVVQLEMGYTFTSDNTGSVRTRAHSLPELLARIGVFADWLEFRIAHNQGMAAVIDDTLGRDNLAGAEDLYLGFKIGLTPQEGILPEMALIPQWTVPTGSDDFSANLVLPGVNWLYGWDINDWLSMGGSSQLNKSVDEASDIYFEFAQSWTIGYAITEHWHAYTEWFVLVPSGSRLAHTQHYLDGGFTFPVTNNWQLDIRAGIGLSEASDDFFAGAGMVVRL